MLKLSLYSCMVHRQWTSTCEQHLSCVDFLFVKKFSPSTRQLFRISTYTYCIKPKIEKRYIKSKKKKITAKKSFFIINHVY